MPETAKQGENGAGDKYGSISFRSYILVSFFFMNNYLDCWVVDMWVSGKISTYPQPGFGRQLFVYEVVSDVVDRSALGICIPSRSKVATSFSQLARTVAWALGARIFARLGNGDLP